MLYTRWVLHVNKAVSRWDDANKLRVDNKLTAATKPLLDRIIDMQRELNRESGWPERCSSVILEMVLRKGAKAWPAARTN